MITHSADLLRSYVDGRYFLKQLVRTADDLSVFLALAGDDSRVSLYLAPQESESSVSWPLAVELSQRSPHQHLLTYLDVGQTSLEGQHYAYLVSEPVEDFVEDVLAERTLTAEETESVLRAVLSALHHLHQHGYSHGAVSPAVVVAAGNDVKLRTEKVIPCDRLDEAEAKRARAGDLLAAGELATMLMSGQTGPEAVLSLPPSLAHFVRATAGTSECPSPSAMQLLGFLDGQPLVPAATEVIPSEPVALQSYPPVSAGLDSERGVAAPQEHLAPARRRGNILMAVVGILVISLIVLVSRRTPKATVPVAGVTPAPVSAPAHRQPPSSPKATSPATQQWAVIAATYGNHDAAARRAAQINSTRRHAIASVLPPRGEGVRYYVVLGTASSRKEAEKLKARAAGPGLPRDTYVTHLRF